MLRMLAAAVLFLLAFTAAHAEVPVPQLMAERLDAGESARLESDLTARLAANPGDDQLRFALGATQFIRTVEGLSQDMYRYGLQTPHGVEMMLPFFRFPVPLNPKPEQLDYDKMRAVFQRALTGFEKSDATLAGMGTADVKLPLAIGLVRLDLDGNGVATEQESLFALFNATLGGNTIPKEAGEKFAISFDRGDASWLRGYSNLLSALIDFLLAHDGKASFDVSAQMLFPNAGLPLAVLDRQGRTRDQYFDMAPAADILAAIHIRHSGSHSHDALARHRSGLDEVRPHPSRDHRGHEPRKLALHTGRNRRRGGVDPLTAPEEWRHRRRAGDAGDG
ncbi:hypothetical protein [Aestuariivirga sp.]|uniref:hypothetical protein n=1 Tax=Aestuariivirga sp. TaxID=2650926 RepID=UPI0035B25EB0